MLDVIKRDGQITEFNLNRITDAIVKAFNATEMQFTNEIVDMISLRVTADFQPKIQDGKIHIEDVQDSVEKVFMT